MKARKKVTLEGLSYYSDKGVDFVNKYMSTSNSGNFLRLDGLNVESSYGLNKVSFKGADNKTYSFKVARNACYEYKDKTVGMQVCIPSNTKNIQVVVEDANSVKPEAIRDYKLEDLLSLYDTSVNKKRYDSFIMNKLNDDIYSHKSDMKMDTELNSDVLCLDSVRNLGTRRNPYKDTVENSPSKLTQFEFNNRKGDVCTFHLPNDNDMIVPNDDVSNLPGHNTVKLLKDAKYYATVGKGDNYRVVSMSGQMLYDMYEHSVQKSRYDEFKAEQESQISADRYDKALSNLNVDTNPSDELENSNQMNL